MNGKCQGFLREDRTGVIHSLSQTKPTKIGRALDCHIILNSRLDSSISKHHAEVRPLAESKGWEICDRRSENGTRVNGQQLWGCQILQPGDHITFGQSPNELIFGVQAPRQNFRFLSFCWKIKQIARLRFSVGTTTLLPLVSRGKWRELWQQRHFKSAIFYLVLCILAISIFSKNETIAYVLIAGCILAIAIETISQFCGRYKPVWLILGLAISTAGLTNITPYAPWLYCHSSTFNIKDIALEAFLKEFIKALPVLAIYFLGRKLPFSWQERIKIHDPLDGILLAVASAIGLVLVMLWIDSEKLINIFVQLAPNISGNLAYSGIFGYYIGMSAIGETRKLWERIGLVFFGYFFASSLHFALVFLDQFLSDISEAIELIPSILEYGILFIYIRKGVVLKNKRIRDQ